MSTPLPPDPGPARQRAIYLPGLAGQRPLVPVAAAELEARAREVMSGPAFSDVAGGAGAEGTMAANRAAFDRRQIVPQVLRDASRRDLSVELLGRTLPAPLLTAPIGVLDLAHPDGDLAVARAAAAQSNCLARARAAWDQRMDSASERAATASIATAISAGSAPSTKRAASASTSG